MLGCHPWDSSKEGTFAFNVVDAVSLLPLQCKMAFVFTLVTQREFAPLK